MTRGAWILTLVSAAGAAIALTTWLRPAPFVLGVSVVAQAAVLMAFQWHRAFRRPGAGSIRPALVVGLLSLLGISYSTSGPIAGLERAGPWLSFLPLLSACWLVSSGWRDRQSKPAFAVLSTTGAALAAAFLAVRLAAETAALQGATAGLAWGALLAAILVKGPAPFRPAHLEIPAATWRDYLALTKPVIVALLLVTTLAGMVVGAGEWPPTGLIVWTMLGGALSAGGASALNQYIDRDLDRRMQRTQRRPFPSGRIGEAEGLAFAVVLCVAGFYTLALAVNLLSALLSLAGMLYYVVLYSLVLKKTTTQNIVVGGGAGAIPPLVGWAAATGTLSMAAFFLFAVIFFWTPPHFWALALLRRKDYARAGIPMLPAVESERSTAWQILLYTVQLVALTLLLPLAGAGGALFLVLAAVFGAGFLAFAWRLWSQGGNRLAHGLYRYSSMYLALIFAALVVDTLVRT
jgi:protoheme IX farnesyltransferase